MLNYYDFTADTAGGESVVEAVGSHFRYVEGWAGGADTRIFLRCDQTGQSVILSPGQSLVTDRRSSWRIINYAKLEIIRGVVFVGEGRIDSDRISGDVAITESNAEKTFGRKTFIAGGQSNGGVNIPLIQLWNPPGSGKNLLLKRYQYTCNIAGSGHVHGSYNVALTNPLRDAKSKYIGEPDGVAKVLSDPFVAIPALTVHFVTQQVANSTVMVDMVEQIVIPPGYGWVIAGVATFFVVAMFEWTEVDA